MKTPEHAGLNQQAISQVKDMLFFAISGLGLLPLGYMCLRMGEEKKAREGLKIMGLRDNQYY